MSLLIAFLSIVCFKEECQDSENGKTDSYGFNCTEGYNEFFVDNCGMNDDDDFSANSMCCACKGKFF